MKSILMFFGNLKFKSKLFFSYVVVCIIPLLALGVYSYYQANGFLRQQAIQGLSESVRQIAGNISFRNTQYESMINSVIYNFKFQQIFNSRRYSSSQVNQDYSEVYQDYVDPFFNNILTQNEDILQISVFTDNPLLLRGEYVQSIEVLDGFDWYASAMESDKTLWLGKNGRLFCARLFSKETDLKGSQSAILFISIDTQRLFASLEDIKAKSYGVVIVDEKGRVIVSKNRDYNPIPDLSGISFRTDNTADIKVEGKNYLVIGADILKPGWKLYYYTPLKSLLVNARSIANATGLIAFLCLLILFIIIWAFSSTFVRRIKQLNHKMQVVENGNLKIDVSSRSRDEIGELTNRFGKMLKNINVLIDEVYHGKIIQKEAELKALQAQINPHFLYNSLSIINWKAIKIDALEISQITNAMSKYYRTVLNKGKNIISTKDEIENAKAYLEIQLIMHSYGFDFVCDVEESIFQYDMLNLILQPVLENALEHGIDMKRKNDGRGSLVLRAYRIPKGIEFSIADNGPGMAPELIDEVLSQCSRGYGLKNVNERIRLFFGEEYGVRIDSQLGNGTTVYVNIPCYTA